MKTKIVLERAGTAVTAGEALPGAPFLYEECLLVAYSINPPHIVCRSLETLELLYLDWDEEVQPVRVKLEAL